MTQVKTKMTAEQWMTIGAICERDNISLDEYAARAIASQSAEDNKELEKHRASLAQKLQEV